MLSSGRRILFIDDDKDTCDLVRFMLRDRNPDYVLITVGNAAEAINLINSQRFDLYILDYRLGGITGVELCRLIRQNDHSVPIMFYSGMANPSARQTAMEAGADAYLVKPNDTLRLTDVVEQLLKSN